MDIETLVKIGGLAVGAFSSAFATWKIFFEMLRGKKNTLRDEYRFAKEFFDYAESDRVHPYISQLGYLALAGDAKAGCVEIAYAISLPSPRTALRDYLSGRSCVEYYSTSSPPGFVFKASYKSPAKRAVLRWWYIIGYFVTYMAGWVPLLLVASKLVSAGVGLPFLVFTATTFFPLSYLSLKGASKLSGAESLIRWQDACKNPHVSNNFNMQYPVAAKPRSI